MTGRNPPNRNRHHARRERTAPNRRHDRTELRPTGQDAAYQAKLLLSKGCVLHSSPREAQSSYFANHQRLGSWPVVTVLSLVREDFRRVFAALKAGAPDEICFLAG
jgi:GDP-D-mannose dehydratase